MRLLLDTHVLLWFLAADRRLQSHLGIIVDPANDVFVSTVSLMEIAVKQRVGKLKADIPSLLAEVTKQSFEFLPLLPKHVAELAALAIHADHRDPFDHQLIAQAIAEDMVFLSFDEHMPRYPVRRVEAPGSEERSDDPEGAG